jgi:signal transduction histidine kinase
LENLFANAVEHAGAGVTVEVGSLADGDGFYVADDGPGIPAEEREAVFDVGYSTGSDGTGFGLNIVNEIVDAHGWEVAVVDAESGGARFEIAGVDTQ